MQVSLASSPSRSTLAFEDRACPPFFELLCAGSIVVLSRGKAVKWPAYGSVEQNTLYAMPTPPAPHMRAPLPITLNADEYKPVEGYKGKNILEPLKGSISKSYWSHDLERT